MRSCECDGMAVQVGHWGGGGRQEEKPPRSVVCIGNEGCGEVEEDKGKWGKVCERGGGKK